MDTYSTWVQIYRKRFSPTGDQTGQYAVTQIAQIPTSAFGGQPEIRAFDHTSSPKRLFITYGDTIYWWSDPTGMPTNITPIR